MMRRARRGAHRLSIAVLDTYSGAVRDLLWQQPMVAAGRAQGAELAACDSGLKRGS